MTPIATSKNGVYELNIRAKRKYSALDASAPTQPLNKLTKPFPRTPLTTVIILANTKPISKPSVVGIFQRLKCRPILKTNSYNKDDTIYYDFHLLFKHSSPKTILNTVRNTKLQMDSSRIYAPSKETLSCQHCAAAKMRAAPHKRKEHTYAALEAI